MKTFYKVYDEEDNLVFETDNYLEGYNMILDNEGYTMDKETYRMIDKVKGKLTKKEGTDE